MKNTKKNQASLGGPYVNFSYSAGDLITAEVGFYFATTFDGDGLNQQANISVLSRYSIKEVYVPKGAAFS